MSNETKEPEVKEPHRFKEGDWVVVTEKDWCKPWHGRVFRVEEANDRAVKAPNVPGWFDKQNLRAASQAEIDAHIALEARKKQEAERRAEEEAKPIEFGTWVKSATTEKTFRTACDGPDAEGDYRCIANDNSVAYLRRSEFTVISPPKS